MKYTKLTDTQFKQLLAAARATSDPDYLAFEKLLETEGRAFAQGLSGPHKQRLYNRWPKRVHIVRNGEGYLVYLDSA